MILEELKAVLPTKTSKWLMGISMTLAIPLLAVPSYLPIELWAIPTLSQLQARLLLAGSLMLLCIFGSFVSVLRLQLKTQHELNEIKKHLTIEQALSFQKKMLDIQNSNR